MLPSEIVEKPSLLLSIKAFVTYVTIFGSEIEWWKETGRLGKLPLISAPQSGFEIMGGELGSAICPTWKHGQQIQGSSAHPRSEPAKLMYNSSGGWSPRTYS